MSRGGEGAVVGTEHIAQELHAPVPQAHLSAQGDGWPLHQPLQCPPATAGVGEGGGGAGESGGGGEGGEVNGGGGGGVSG